jgi:4'-phosphopantetheinyl transferase
MRAPDPPDPDEVVVCWMDVRGLSPGTVDRWHARLDVDRQERADRFRFARDRAVYVAAHALERLLLTTATGLPYAELRFVTGPHGKPELGPTPGCDLHFNLSHTRGLVAIAVAVGHPVGIDVEAADRPDIGPELAERYFAPDEVDQLWKAPPERRYEIFLRFWTLKESYIKATGEGLSCPLDSFSFTLDPIRIAFRDAVADEPSRWQFCQQHPTNGHVLAVALHRAEGRPARFNIRQVARHEV